MAPKLHTSVSNFAPICWTYVRHDVTTIFSVEHVNLRAGVQKEPWFINTLNPNGKIPVLVDRNRPTTTGAEGFAVFESAAILLYLSQHYDPERKLWFDPEKQPVEYSEMTQWIFFTVRLRPHLQARLGPNHPCSTVASAPYNPNVRKTINSNNKWSLTPSSSGLLQHVCLGRYSVCKEV